MCVFIWKIIKSHQQANIYISPDQSSGYASACYIEERRCFVFKTEEMIQKHKLRKVISVVLATVCIVLLTCSHWHCLSLLPHVFNLLFAYCSRPHGKQIIKRLIIAVTANSRGGQTSAPGRSRGVDCRCCFISFHLWGHCLLEKLWCSASEMIYIVSWGGGH